MLAGMQTPVPGATAAPLGCSPTSARHTGWSATSLLLEGCKLSTEEVVGLFVTSDGSETSISISKLLEWPPVECWSTLVNGADDVSCSL